MALSITSYGKSDSRAWEAQYSAIGKDWNSMSYPAEQTRRLRRPKPAMILPFEDATATVASDWASRNARSSQALNSPKQDQSFALGQVVAKHKANCRLKEESACVQSKPRHSAQSLATPRQKIAQRRTPLQHTGRMLQATARTALLPGQGGGKENVPPGMDDFMAVCSDLATIAPQKITVKTRKADASVSSTGSMSAGRALRSSGQLGSVHTMQAPMRDPEWRKSPALDSTSAPRMCPVMTSSSAVDLRHNIHPTALPQKTDVRCLVMNRPTARQSTDNVQIVKVTTTPTPVRPSSVMERLSREFLQKYVDMPIFTPYRRLPFATPHVYLPNGRISLDVAIFFFLIRIGVDTGSWQKRLVFSEP